MFRIGPAMVRLDVVDSTQMAFTVEPVQQPGTTFDVIFCFRIDPGGVKFVVWTQIEGLDPDQKIIAAKTPPSLQVGIADAAVVGINQTKAAMTAVTAMESVLHRLYTVIELFV